MQVQFWNTHCNSVNALIYVWVCVVSEFKLLDFCFWKWRSCFKAAVVQTKAQLKLHWNPKQNKNKKTKQNRNPKWARFIKKVIFTACRNTNPLSHDNNAVVNTSARITSSQIDSKLDVHHRNNYNRTNHRLQHSPQIVVGDDVDVDYAQQSNNDPSSYWNNGIARAPPLSGSMAPAAMTAIGAANVNTAIGRITSQSRSQSGSLSAGTSLDDPSSYSSSIDNRRYTERRKKTVRFDGQESNDWTRWESERQNSQDSTTRDSGIDTSSTFTSSEDSNRGDGLKVYHNHIHIHPF